MKARNSLLIWHDIEKREISITEHNEVTSSPMLNLGKFSLDELKRTGRVDAAKWIGQSIVFHLSGLRESFYDMKSKENYYLIPPSDQDANALEHLSIAMSLMVRAVELDSAVPLDEAKLHLIQAQADGLSMAGEVIDTLLPKLKSTLRTDFS
jgi:hypothetical protein